MQKTVFENFIKIKFLQNIEGIGPYRILSLLSRFNTLDSLLGTGIKELMKVEGISKTNAEKILSSGEKINEIKLICAKEYENLNNLGGRIISIFSDDYPEILKKIYLPPLLIYTLGAFTDADKFSLAIVGTRQPTNYGKTKTRILSTELAKSGLTIVSGLARGIDSIAHDSALTANGRTIAVIGSGLDVIYPSENKKLFERIQENGVIVSEFPLSTKPDAQNFPKRNRIISGLSLGTLVIESAKKGGALQTASYALDQNREIFALPGNIDVPQSTGTNLIIQKGEAKLIVNAKDIIDELSPKFRPLKESSKHAPPIELTLFENSILNILSGDPAHIDEIAAKSKLTTPDCLVNLLSLEFKGLAKQLPGKNFIAC